MNGTDPNRVAAMAAAASSLGRRVSESLATGALAEVSIRSDDGNLFIYSAGQKAVLAVMGPVASNAGLIHLEARDVAKQIADLFSRTRAKRSPSGGAPRSGRSLPACAGTHAIEEAIDTAHAAAMLHRDLKPAISSRIRAEADGNDGHRSRASLRTFLGYMSGNAGRGVRFRRS